MTRAGNGVRPDVPASARCGSARGPAPGAESRVVLVVTEIRVLRLKRRKPRKTVWGSLARIVRRALSRRRVRAATRRRRDAARAIAKIAPATELLYRIESRTDQGRISRMWQYTAYAQYACPGCGRPRVDAYPQPLPVEYVEVPRSSLGGGCGAAPVVEREMLELLQGYEPGIMAGPVALQSGLVLPDRFSLHFPPSANVLARGGPGSAASRYGYLWCATCARPSSIFGLLTPPQHVLRRERPAGDVLVEGNSTLIVSERVRNDPRLRRYRDLMFRPLPVLEERLEHVPLIDGPVAGEIGGAPPG